MRKIDWVNWVITIALVIGTTASLYASYLKLEYLKIENEILKNKLHTIEENTESMKMKMEAKKTAFEQSLNCLANNIYYEAGFEPEEGKIAVAQVTINRLHDPNRPKTICDVVYEKGQFTWTRQPLKSVNPKIYRDAVQIAKRFLTKREKSTIIGTDVKNYHAIYVSPSWAQTLEPVATIGNHIFYK